jgi:hypothetical protein
MGRSDGPGQRPTDTAPANSNAEPRAQHAAERQRMIDQHVAASNAFTKTHGRIADEYSTL